MRVKEPLNGFRKAQGHIIFHITLLSTSYYILRPSFSKGPVTADCDISEAESPENVASLIQWIRLMHAILIGSSILRKCIENVDNLLVVELFKVVEVFFYIGTILYQQYFVLKYPPLQCEDLYVFLSKSWMMMELFIFYSLQINAAIFLAYIHCRGIFGKKLQAENRNRFKFDALDYYDNDIEWSSFQFVPIGLCVTGLLITLKIARESDKMDQYILGIIIFERLIQFILMSPFRNQKRVL